MDLYEPMITPHYLRHHYVTLLFYAGFNATIAMWMVGHESYQTTVDIYTHLRKARFQETRLIWNGFMRLNKRLTRSRFRSVQFRTAQRKSQKSCTTTMMKPNE